MYVEESQTGGLDYMYNAMVRARAQPAARFAYRVMTAR